MWARRKHVRAHGKIYSGKSLCPDYALARLSVAGYLRRTSPGPIIARPHQAHQNVKKILSLSAILVAACTSASSHAPTQAPSPAATPVSAGIDAKTAGLEKKDGF